mgnify:CR=1 FL=1
MLVARIYLSIVDIDITEVVSELRMWEKAIILGLYTLLDEIPVVVIFIQTTGIRNIEIILISGNSLTSLNLYDFLQTILSAQMLG